MEPILCNDYHLQVCDRDVCMIDNELYFDNSKSDNTICISFKDGLYRKKRALCYSKKRRAFVFQKYKYLAKNSKLYKLQFHHWKEYNNVYRCEPYIIKKNKVMFFRLRHDRIKIDKRENPDKKIWLTLLSCKTIHL
jgi:hypothetical protein